MAQPASTRLGEKTLPKSPTGITGLDQITDGGLPRGRPTLVCGGAGSGKTLLAMHFLIQGAMQFNEPGVFMSFEEKEDDLVKNVASLGYDLNKLMTRKKLAIDYVRVERSEIEETGEYDLEGLFVRLSHAIDSIGAKRVVLDTIESLFAGLSNAAILRSELRRLFAWLKDKGVTAVITGERGDGQLTRQGLEEYVSDCVILLDHRVNEQVSTRRLRIVKYRGSTHGTNEYPFLIDRQGLHVMPVTALGLEHKVSTRRVSSGVERLDTMLDGKGYFQGGSVLVTGSAGTGKTTLAASFVDAACRRGEKCVYLAFEESPDQIIRNMRSVGIDLEPHVASGKLVFHAARASLYGLEQHLAAMHRVVEQQRPDHVVVDPITNLMAAGTRTEIYAVFLRLLDFLKSQRITALFTSLIHGSGAMNETETGVSSLMDTWILLQTIETGGERNRGLYVIKSRGMAHSNQIREFVLTRQGVRLLDAYAGPEGILTGTARLAQEVREKSEAVARKEEIERRRRELESTRQEMEAQIARLRTQFAAKEDELQRAIRQGQVQEQAVLSNQKEMARVRGADKGNGQTAR